MTTSQRILYNLRNVSLFKTLWLNVHCFGWRRGWRLPVFVYRHTLVERVKKSAVVVEGPLQTGMIRIGQRIQTTIAPRQTTVLNLYGRVVFAGSAVIGNGTALMVEDNACLRLGRNFTVTGRSTICCKTSVTFGDDCLLSWDVQVMDDDHHELIASDGARLNAPQPIVLGRHVWVCSRVSLLKGTCLPDDCIVAAGSTVSRRVEESGCLVGDRGKVIRRNIQWRE